MFDSVGILEAVVRLAMSFVPLGRCVLAHKMRLSEGPAVLAKRNRQRIAARSWVADEIVFPAGKSSRPVLAGRVAIVGPYRYRPGHSAVGADRTVQEPAVIAVTKENVYRPLRIDIPTRLAQSLGGRMSLVNVWILPGNFLNLGKCYTKMCLLDGRYTSIEARFVMPIARIE